MRCGRPYRHALHEWERWNWPRNNDVDVFICDGGSDEQDEADAHDLQNAAENVGMYDEFSAHPVASHSPLEDRENQW